MIFLSLIYDYIIMGNLTVSEENNSKIDISSVQLMGTQTGKEGTRCITELWLVKSYTKHA